MAASNLVNFSGLVDDAKCFALVRMHRWPEGVRCPGCSRSYDRTWVTTDWVCETGAHGGMMAVKPGYSGAITCSVPHALHTFLFSPGCP